MAIRELRWALCGDPASGKTSLILASESEGGVDVACLHDYYPTLLESSRRLFSGQETIQLNIVDLSGLPEFETLRRQQYQDVDVFLLCFSIAQPRTFQALSQWVKEIRRVSATSPIILVGCQSDLRNEQQKDGELTLVSASEASKVAETLGAFRYVECSALTGENVYSVMECAVELSNSYLTKTPNKMLKRPSSSDGDSQMATLKKLMKKGYALVQSKEKGNESPEKPHTLPVVHLPETQAITVVKPKNPLAARLTTFQPGPAQRSRAIPILAELPKFRSKVNKSVRMRLSDPILVGLSDPRVQWRDSLHKSLEETYGKTLPVRNAFWSEIRGGIALYPFAIHYSLQLIDHMRSLGGDYLNVFPWPSEGLLDKMRENFCVPNLLILLSQHEETKNTLLRVKAALNSETVYGAESVTNSRVWLKLLGEAECYDLLDLEKTFLVLLESYSADNVYRAGLSSTALCRLIDLLHELLRQGEESESHRKLMRFLRKIVLKTGQLPASMVIDNVERGGSNPIAGGGFADVWRGHYLNQAVALKVIRVYGQIDSGEHILRTLCAEALVWHRVKHRNVMPFYGVCVLEFAPQYALVSPWMANGNMSDYIRKQHSCNRTALMTGVADGMAYLHALNPPIVHGDLRAANVLIDDAEQPRISDFGLATFMDAHTSTLDKSSYKGKGSIRWQAPELLSSTRFSEVTPGLTMRSDVYAFACVCYEIFAEQVPFAHLRDGEVILEVAVRDGRPTRPARLVQSGDVSDAVWSLIESCWAVEPKDRPRMPDVLERVQLLQKTSKIPPLSYSSTPMAH